MREQIDKLAKGIVAYDKPEIKISQTNITIYVNEGDTYKGNFLIESKGDKAVKGIVYATTERMKMEKNQFESVSQYIEYVFDSHGMEVNDMVKGAFYVVSSGGEFEIPFTVFVKRSKEEESENDGVLHSSIDLLRIVRKNHREGFKIFASDGFERLLRKEQADSYTLYKGLKRKGINEWDLEEYLIATGQKEKVELKISNSEKTFFELDKSKKVTFRMKKNTWGYLPMQLGCDADFVQLEHTVMNAGDFIGNEWELSYVVNKERIHEGTNYARITILTPYQKLYHTITVNAPLDRDVETPGRKEIKKYTVELIKQYIDFRLKRINKEAWLKGSLERLERLKELDEEQEFYPLFQVQMYLAEKRMEEAKWVLDKYAKKRWGKGQQYELYAYYLYLNTIQRRDQTYTKRVREEVGKLYVKDKKWQYLWILLYLDSRLAEEPVKKLELIARQQKNHACNLLLALEASLTYIKDITLLTGLGSFEKMILRFAARYGALTKELAGRTGELALREKTFDPAVFQLLEHCYELYQEPAMLTAICGMLIKGNKTDHKYFQWYEKAVAKEVKLTRLYEYYIYAMEESEYRILPKVILMYYSYQTNLDDRKKALLYANIITYGEQYPSVYPSYRKQIERFMVEQLKKRRMNRHLAVIYKAFLSKGIMDEELAEDFAHILFTYEVKVERSDIKNIIVLHKDLEREQIVPCVQRRANVQIYSPHHKLIFQDSRGIRYVDSIVCEKEKLLEESLFEEVCPDYPNHHIGYLLHQWKRSPIEEHTISLFVRIYRSEYVSREAKQHIQKEVLLSYQLMNDVDWVAEFLPELDFDMLNNRERNILLDVLLDRGMFERAYRFISNYGVPDVSAKKLIKLVNRMIREKEYEKDEILLQLSGFVFEAGRYDPVILEYLCDYYNRDTRVMGQIWEASKDMGVETDKLEERLIAQVLFTGTYLGVLKDVYQSYEKKSPNWRIKKAYLVKRSYEYFVRDFVTEDELFQSLEGEHYRGQKLELICKLALLRYYSGQKLTDGPRKKMLETFLRETVYNNKLFACSRAYPIEMTAPYFLPEKAIIEHRAHPDKRVMVYYRILREGEQKKYQGEEMKQNYEGVYTKVLPLFAGETLDYYITESVGESPDSVETKKVSEEKIVNPHAVSGLDSRFTYINSMYEAEDIEQQTRLMEEYARKEKLTGKMFKIR